MSEITIVTIKYNLIAKIIVKRHNSEEIILRPDMTLEELKKTQLFYEHVYELEGFPDIRLEINRYKFMYEFVLVKAMDNEMSHTKHVTMQYNAVIIRSIIHIPGIRGNYIRTYPNPPIGDTFPGVFTNYFASVISKWKNENDLRIKKLKSWLYGLAISNDIGIKYIDDSNIEILISRLINVKSYKKSDFVSIADVGFGVSQVLPVLVAMLVAEPGQLVYIEQPELHLHPRAQVKLAELIVETAKRKVILIIETHSSIILKTIQSLVAEGKLTKDLVKLYWFRRREDGSSEVTSGSLDKKGAYGDWPEDFSDIDLETEKRFLDAVME